jgi:hypothetical protein
MHRAVQMPAVLLWNATLLAYAAAAAARMPEHACTSSIDLVVVAGRSEDSSALV